MRDTFEVAVLGVGLVRTRYLCKLAEPLVVRLWIVGAWKTAGQCRARAGYEKGPLMAVAAKKDDHLVAP